MEATESKIVARPAATTPTPSTERKISQADSNRGAASKRRKQSTPVKCVTSLAADDKEDEGDEVVMETESKTDSSEVLDTSCYSTQDHSNGVVVVEGCRHLPIHCMVEVSTGNYTEDGSPFYQLEVDDYTLVPNDLPVSNLPKEALIQLGYTLQHSSIVTGFIQIVNWKPLTLECITDDPRVSVDYLFANLMNVATLRIQITSNPSVVDQLRVSMSDGTPPIQSVSLTSPVSESSTTTSLSKPDSPMVSSVELSPSIPPQSPSPQQQLLILDIKEKLDSLLKNHKQAVLVSHGCPFSQAMISQIVLGKYVNKISSEKSRAFYKWHEIYTGLSKDSLIPPRKKSSRLRRMRTLFDPKQELPRLRRWFADNSRPSKEQMLYYFHELNSLERRKKGTPLRFSSIVLWFKNARAKYKNDCSMYDDYNGPNTCDKPPTVKDIMHSLRSAKDSHMKRIQSAHASTTDVKPPPGMDSVYVSSVNSASPITGANSAAIFFSANSTPGISSANPASSISGKNSTSGISGTNSTPGISGTNSTSCISGTNSTSGISGTNSTSGISGTNSTPGISGTNSISCISGTNSTSGISGANSTSSISGTNFTSGKKSTPGISSTNFTSGTHRGNVSTSSMFASSSTDMDTVSKQSISSTVPRPEPPPLLPLRIDRKIGVSSSPTPTLSSGPVTAKKSSSTFHPPTMMQTSMMTNNKSERIADSIMHSATVAEALFGKRKRHRFSIHPLYEVPKLKAWFVENPRPDYALKEQIIHDLNTSSFRVGREKWTMKTVTVWFKNARAKMYRNEFSHDGVKGSETNSLSKNQSLVTSPTLTPVRPVPDSVPPVSSGKIDSPNLVDKVFFPVSISTPLAGSSILAACMSTDLVPSNSLDTSSTSSTSNFDAKQIKTEMSSPNTQQSFEIKTESVEVNTTNVRVTTPLKISTPEPATVPSSVVSPTGSESSQMSYQEQEKIFRINSSFELPRLRQWFEDNPNPTALTMSEYVDTLNATPFRQLQGQKYNTEILNSWFDLERQKMNVPKLVMVETNDQNCHGDRCSSLSNSLCSDSSGADTEEEWTDVKVRNAITDVLKEINQSQLGQISPLTQSMISCIVNGKYGATISKEKCQEFGQWYENYKKSKVQLKDPPKVEKVPRYVRYMAGRKLSFHPEHEVPRMKEWFDMCQHPIDETLQGFCNIMNTHPFRQQTGRPITVTNLRVWWKNERAKRNRESKDK